MKPISIIIISYNRPDDALELLQNLVKMDHAAELVEEVIFVNNASTISYQAVQNFVNESRFFPIKYYNPGVNLGVAKGRNYAIKKSKAPILFMLDDDAVLANNDALIQLLKAFSENGSKPLGALACKVLYYDTGDFQKSAFPHKDFDQRKNLRYFDTYYFTGCAHALNRDALQLTGMYPEDFFYGMEEYDLGYRLLDAGFSIKYSADVVLLHKESPLGRTTQAEKVRMMWVNKAKVAWRYLSVLHFLSTAILWSIFFLRKTNFNWQHFAGGWRAIFKIPVTEKKRPLKKEVKQYLHSVKARMWY